MTPRRGEWRVADSRNQIGLQIDQCGAWGELGITGTDFREQVEAARFRPLAALAEFPSQVLGHSLHTSSFVRPRQRGERATSQVSSCK
jgi:hypothetical protein